jgi:hypothetical protein
LKKAAQKSVSKKPQSVLPRKSGSVDVVLAVVLAAGLGLRLYGIGFGLPFLYDIDEPTFVHKAVAMLATRDPNPHWFGHPGTTVMTLLSVLYAAIFLLGRAFGAFADAGAYKALYYRDPTLFYVSGRILTAAFAVLALWLAYKIARRLFNRKTGLIAAAFLALSPLFVAQSRLIRTDVPMTFLILCVLWFCLEILEKGTWRSYVLAGITVGLAVATKYPAAVAAAMVLAAWIFRRRWEEWTRLAVSGAAGVAGLFAGSPFLFLDFRSAAAGIQFEERSTHLSATGEGFFRNLFWYSREPLQNALPWAGIILLAVGAALCAVSRDARKRLLLVFPVLFWLFIASQNLRWIRWILPAVPFFCMLAAHAVQRIASRIGRNKTGGAAAALLVLAFLLPALKTDLVLGRELSGKDTRTQARDWILENVPKGSRIMLENYTPQLPTRDYVFLIVDEKGDLVEVDPGQIPQSFFRPLYAQIGMLKDVCQVEDRRVDYMIISHWFDRLVYERDKSPEYEKRVQVYLTLIHSGEKVLEISRVYGRNAGPPIRIYRFTRTSGKNMRHPNGNQN